jgi:hypothetical protein
VLHQPASVRLEEYVKRIPYLYPTPAVSDATPFYASISMPPATSSIDRRPMLASGLQRRRAPGGQRPAEPRFSPSDVVGQHAERGQAGAVQRILRNTLEVLTRRNRRHRQYASGHQALRLQPTPVRESGAITELFDRGPPTPRRAASTAGAAV